MASPNRGTSVRTARRLTRLRRRRDVQCLTLYLGAAWILYESVALTVDIFEFPILVARVTAIVLAVGAFASIPLARWYELTARAVDRKTGEDLVDVPGVPDVLEPALASGYRKVGRRSIMLAAAGSAVLFPGFFFVLWNAWAEGHAEVAPDPRVSVAVFPFRTSGTEAGVAGEGIADLLVVTLDGTPGVRVMDPAGFWRPLRPERGAPARAPELDEAKRLSRGAPARRFVTGTVISGATTIDLIARVYDTESGAALASLRSSANTDDLATAVDRLAVDLVTSIWEREQLPTVPEIDRLATDNADALKAYLEAKSLARRGQFAPAQAAIERAVALDSTFALAHLEHFNIRSWLLYLNSQPFVGLREIIERAMRHRERLTPRNRLRVEANMALDDTDGAQAAFLFERILGIDSLDVEALNSLAFTYLRDGWQIEKSTDEILAAYERALRVDPGAVTARLTRAWIALWTEDTAAARRHYDALEATDSSAVVRGRVGAYRALVAPPTARDSILRALAAQPIPIATTALRDLRQVRPALAERFCDELTTDSMPSFHQRVGSGARTQLWLAEGRQAAVDSLVTAGELDRIRPVVNRFFVASHLTGIGDPTAVARSVAELAAFAPAESLAAYLDTKPAVWATAWAVGAHHAAFGDTAEARVWQRAIAELPTGDTWWDWTGSLSADIEARLAMRRGDLDTALDEAQRAYDLWTIHSNYVGEADPEPAMRFHLAEVLAARGDTDRAAWLFRSFNPPYTWIGFYTARASLEVGLIEEARRNYDEAVRFYLMAARLWERGEPEVVGPWLARAEDGLRRLSGERNS
ncbi:MAG: hypothetical protein PVJ64_08675 [Gemmatimonadales bacterium]|jgi:tetratricopeptide (TPR) repeat protein